MGIFRKAAQSIASLTSQGEIGTYAGFGKSVSGGNLAVDRALGCATVFNCVAVISSGIGEIEIRAPENNALDEVLQRPNAWQDRSDFYQSIAWGMLTEGQMFVGINGGTKTPVQLVPYEPDEVKVIVGPGRIPAYEIKKSNKIVPADRMLHFRDIGTQGSTIHTRINAASSRIRALIEADKMIADVFKNGVLPTFLVKSKRKLDKKEMQTIVAGIKDSAGRASSSRGGVLLLQAELEYEIIQGLKPADADLRELRVHLIREVASVFGVPPFLAGGDSDTKYSNTSSRISAMYRQSFSPILKRIRGALESKFQTPIKIDDSVLMKGDFATQIANGVQLCGGPYWTPNEVRDIQHDMDPIDGGDELRLSPAVENAPGGDTPTDDGVIDDLPQN